jgi:PAS domain S-box-containing protein
VLVLDGNGLTAMQYQRGQHNQSQARAIERDPVQPLTNSPELQLIYETAPIGLAFLSTDCRYVMINQRLTEICGLPIANHLGRTVRETVPQVAEQVESIVQAILRTGESITGIEVNGQRPDGSNKDRIWITYWHPLKDRSGQIVGINVAAEEITERKRIEADLAANQEELRSINVELAERAAVQAQERDRIWNLAQDLFVVSDPSGGILNINPAWGTILGWSPGDLVGKTAEWLLHPEDRERSFAELANLSAGRKVLHFENRIKSQDGSYRWLSWFAVQDRGLIYATGRDITDLKRAEEQLHILRRELADASRQATVGVMTASIAHEIKQPLTAIVANASAGLRWLKGSDPNLARAQSNLDHIVKAGIQLGEVIDSTRAMFGKESTERELVDVRLLVGNVLALARSELDSHQVVLRNEMREGLPKVMAARVQLQQVMLNLIMNAIEAMSSVPGRERRLTIGSHLDQTATLTITVEDTGIGIDSAHFNRIFDPFFTTKTHGMGLGLSICRSIIEAHGGKLRASPRNPFGSCFYLSLPISAASSGQSSKS